ncbi:hypothetical protein ACFWDG_06505 [Peribacillus sp. NPDC060186]
MYKKGKGKLLKSDGISAVSLLEGRSKDFLPQSGRLLAYRSCGGNQAGDRN